MTPTQIEEYQREGYLTLEPIFASDEVLRFADAYATCLDQLRQQDDLRNIRGGQLEDGTQTQVNQIRCAHLFHPVFADLVRDPRILDRVESLIGPDLRLILCQGLYKPAHTGGEIGWHQDDYYFGVSKQNAVVSCWMAFDDVTPENGCMWVIPRAHSQLWEHEEIEAGGFTMADPDESAALPLPLKAGQIMFHHGATPPTVRWPTRPINLAQLWRSTTWTRRRRSCEGTGRTSHPRTHPSCAATGEDASKAMTTGPVRYSPGSPHGHSVGMPEL